MSAHVRMALLLNSEVANVITAMRQNEKWAVVTGKYNEDDRMEADPLYEEFRNLRRKVFQWDDWTVINPQEYLAPFLNVIRSQEVSGPITGVALTSLWRLLHANFIGVNTVGVREAVKQVVDDTTQCKFEATLPASDEVVLFNILQVLLAVVKCDAGVLLTDDLVCKAYQAAFMLGNLETDPKNKPSRECSELLTHYSRQIIGEMTTTIFQRLAEQTYAKTDMDVDLAGVPYSAYGHGVQAAAEVLTFLIDLIRGHDGEADDLSVFGFQMVQSAVLAGGAALQQLPPIMMLIQRDLFAAMVPSVRSASLAVISSICQVVLALFQVLGDTTILQLEAIIKRVLIKLADGELGKGTGLTIEQQEAALEGILDLCRQPGFIHNIFINCDCRIERYNLFEDICTLVSRMAYPSTQNGSRLGPLHLIALEALIAILHALARTGNSSGLLAQLSTTLELTQYVNIWSALAQGEAPAVDVILDKAFPLAMIEHAAATGAPYPDVSIRAAAAEKLLKIRVAVAADHFNRDYKKGFQFLQSNRLLPPPVPSGTPDPATEEALAIQVAHFIRTCPGLAKQAIGELLGEPDKFYLKALDAFTATFNFRDVPFDIALRMFLESFRLPGEAQKIDRILSSFGQYYFNQCTELFNNSDAAYILAFATIMLNTDRHNAQVKNKINMEGFKRNLRSQNGGQDFPPEFLEDIYNSILRNEIRLNETSSMYISPSTWTVLSQMSSTPRGKMMPVDPAGASVFNAHMFQLMWVPAVHAVSVVLEFAESQGTIELVLEGLQLAARIAAQYDVDPVLDQIAVALCRMTQVLNASNPKAILKFGGDGRACLATQTLFKIVNRYGDCLRQGWFNVMDVVVRLHKLGMLPMSVRKLLESDDSNADSSGEILISAGRLAAVQVPKPSGYGASAFLRSVGNLLVLQDDKSGEMTTEAQKELQTQALKCIENCHIDEMFADSKFLRAESLVKLVKAIIMASGIPRPASGPAPDWEITEICVDLLMTVLLRNRDRISLLWPSVYEFLQSIITGVTPASGMDVRVVERAVLGLLRLCTRLLPYKVEDVEVAEHLLRGLQLVQKLDVELAWQIAEKIAAEVLALIKGAARFIQHSWAWSSVCLLLQMTAMKPEAFGTAFEALRWCVAEDCLMPINFRQCVSTVHFFTDRAAQDHSAQLPAALALLEHMGVWLEAWVEQVVSQEVPPEEEATHWTHRVKPEYWKALVEKLCQLCTHPNIDVRIKSAALLQRSVVGAEKMGVPAEHWDTVITTHILPALKDMTNKVNSRDYPQAHITVRELVKVLSKVMLLVLPVLLTLPHFGQLWCSILDSLAATTSYNNDQLAESVPEALKNMLLVMHSKGVLTPGWQDANGVDLWDITWKKCKKVSSSFSPAMLPGQS